MARVFRKERLQLPVCLIREGWWWENLGGGERGTTGGGRVHLVDPVLTEPLVGLSQGLNDWAARGWEGVRNLEAWFALKPKALVGLFLKGPFDYKL